MRAPRFHGIRRVFLAVFLALGAAGAACSSDFTPRSVLADLRVLAIQASPLEVGPGETVTLTPVRLAPPGKGATITDERWSFCPFSVGGTVGYACAVPACEVPLHSEGTPSGDPVLGVAVTADPGALAQQCLAQLEAQGGAPPSVPSQLPQIIDTVFRYVATASDGETREAVQLVPFYLDGAPAVRNLPPVIQEVDIGGQEVSNGDTGPALGPGVELEVRVRLDPASIQSYVDDAGRTIEETLIVSFFTTVGRFDYDRASGPDARVKLKHDKIGANDSAAQLWAVASDLRGGAAVAGPFTVPIRR
ncbi:MAG: hypothetical protein A2V77_06955 [Anaeromyxobacter sp. RBG_16_69_14]|nr:MAG: hypothetical protein A2V77_06955 [Anaeromyxobacter sp. RBG_16_69_14]